MKRIDDGISYFILPAIASVMAHRLTRDNRVAAAAFLGTAGLAWGTRNRPETTAKVLILSFMALAGGTLVFLARDKIEEAVPFGAGAGFGTFLLWPVSSEADNSSTDQESNPTRVVDHPTLNALRDAVEKLQDEAIADRSVDRICYTATEYRKQLEKWKAENEKLTKQIGLRLNFIINQCTEWSETSDNLAQLKADKVRDSNLEEKLKAPFYLMPVTDDGNCALRAVILQAYPELRCIAIEYYEGQSKNAINDLKKELEKLYESLEEQMVLLNSDQPPLSLLQLSSASDGKLLPMLEWSTLQHLLSDNAKADERTAAVARIKATVQGLKKLAEKAYKEENTNDEWWIGAWNCLLTERVIRVRKMVQEHVAEGIANGKKDVYTSFVETSLGMMVTDAQKNRAGVSKALRRSVEEEGRGSHKDDEGKIVDFDLYYDALSHWDKTNTEIGCQWFGNVEMLLLAETLGVNIVGFAAGYKSLKGDKLSLDGDFSYGCEKTNAEKIYVWNAQSQQHYYALLPKHREL